MYHATMLSMYQTIRARARETLRWSERYLKTDMVYLAHGGSWLFLSQIVAATASLGIAIGFARFFPREEYGTYKFLLTLLGVITLTCLRGMDSIVTQASSRNNDGTVLYALYTKVRWGILGSLCSVGIGVYYYMHANTTIASAMFLAALFIPYMDPIGIYSSILNGKRDFRLLAILDSTSQIAATVILLIGMTYAKSAALLFFLYCASWTLARSIALWISLKKYPATNAIENGWREYGLHTSLVGSMSVVLASIDGFAVFHFLGASELAVYTFAMAPILQMRNLSAICTTLATPKFAIQNGSVIREHLAHRSRVLFMIGLGVVACWILAAHTVYAVLFPQYIDAVPFSQVFSITIALSLGSSLVAGVINSRITLVPKHLLYLWNIPSLILGIGSITLIQYFGIWGAIVSQILSSIATASIGWFIWMNIRYRTFSEESAHSA